MALRAYKLLDKYDIRILQVIEVSMAKFLYVPIRVILSKTKFTEKFLLKRLSKLNELGLLSRRKGAYIGYILTTRGYDCLALNVLFKKGLIEKIEGSPIGIGKESDVFIAYTPAGEEVVLKFHRLGRTSFRQTRRFRTYIGERRHISWLYESRLSAEKEYQALKILYPEGISVPKPIFHNRHVVVMSALNGKPLFEVRELSEPEKVLNEILDNIKRAYAIGIIHGDLSEYNVIIDLDTENITIIDWPQWISANHPQAYFYIKRDLLNILKFFRRKFKVTKRIEDCMKFLSGG